MVNYLKEIRWLVVALGIWLLGGMQPAVATDSTYVRFNTSLGNIDVQMLSDEAPANVNNFMSYVQSGAYNNVIINRSVPGFVFQAGEYTLVTGSSGDSIGANTPASNVTGEASLPGAHSNTRGTIAFALSADPNTGLTDPNSGNIQWFFNEVDNNSSSSPANLDSQGFTVFGVVANASSLAVMDAISNVPVYTPPNFFVSQTQYDADPNPDDYAFGRVPLDNFNAANGLFVSNLVIVNSITTLTTTPFTAWQAAFQNDPQAATDSLPAATPQNDGVTNLLKYVCDVTPNQSMTATDRAKLPTVSHTTISGTNYMTLTYRQRSNLVGVFVNVETSSDLVTWAAPTNATTTQTATTDGTNDVIMQVQVPAPATGATFIRLQVSQ